MVLTWLSLIRVCRHTALKTREPSGTAMPLSSTTSLLRTYAKGSRAWKMLVWRRSMAAVSALHAVLESPTSCAAALDAANCTATACVLWTPAVMKSLALKTSSDRRDVQEKMNLTAVKAVFINQVVQIKKIRSTNGIKFMCKERSCANF